MSEHNEVEDVVDRKNDRAIARASVAAIGTLGVMVMGITGWMFNELLETKQFRQSTKEHEQYIYTRLNDLESGRTSRMAIETRTELDALWRELGYRRPTKDGKE